MNSVTLIYVYFPSLINIHCHTKKEIMLYFQAQCCAIYKVTLRVNLSPPSAVYMRQWTGSALFQIMTCHLFGAKPLPEQMLVYCQLDSWEHISVKFEPEFYHFHSRKCIRNCRLPRCRPFCPGGGGGGGGGNTPRPQQNQCPFTDDIFKRISWNDNIEILN